MYLGGVDPPAVLEHAHTHYDGLYEERQHARQRN